MFINQLKNINYRLLLVLMLGSLIPLVYSTTRIHLLGNLPDTWAFSIAAQVAWLNISYEVLSEALIIPLAYILGQVIDEKCSYKHRVSTSLVVVLFLYALMTTFVIAFTPELVSGMQQETSLIAKTIGYIRLESVAILVSSVLAFLRLVLLLKDNRRALYTLLTLQTVLTLIGDSVFVSQLPISLQLGVNGIAVTNILVNLVLAIVSIGYLANDGVHLSHIKWRNQQWIKEWIRIGAKSGLESFVRNLAFLVMVLQLINQVQQAGTYWVTNSFIWGWLLLPVLALGDLVKQDTATNKGLSVERVNSYLALTLGFVLIWFISMPLWQSFMTTVMGVKQAEPLAQLARLLVGFYVVFALNNVIDNYFYGLGRTDLMLYQSLAVNIVYYGGTFVAYRLGWFVPSLEKIALMFGTGLIIDAVITAGIYLWLRLAERKNLALA